MGSAVITGTKSVGNTPPSSSAQSADSSPVLRHSAQTIDALAEYDSSEIAAPRIRIWRGSIGQEHLEVSIPGGVLGAEDQSAILTHFGVKGLLPRDRKKVVGFANEYMSLAVECGIHPEAFCEAAGNPRCREPEIFAWMAYDKSRKYHLGKKPNQHARIAYEKLESLTRDVPLRDYISESSAGRIAECAGVLTDDELKRWKGSALIKLLANILLCHIPALSESGHLRHLVLAAKAMALGAPYLDLGAPYITKEIWQHLKLDALLNNLVKHAKAALKAENQERIEKCLDGLLALETLSPEEVKRDLEATQKGLAELASMKAAARREDLEEWFKDQGLVTAGLSAEEFHIKGTGHPGAQYDSLAHGLKAVELAAAWAFDPHGPPERALVILRYVSAQSIKQGAATARHMKELRAACLDIQKQLAASNLEEHCSRALEIEAFLDKGHFATEDDVKEWFGVQKIEPYFDKGEFEFVRTTEQPVRYISTSHAYKAVQLARVWALDPEVPIEQAPAVLRYVFDQAVRQDAPASHMKALRAACREIADQLASSDVPGLKQRAEAIETFS